MILRYRLYSHFTGYVYWKIMPPTHKAIPTFALLTICAFCVLCRVWKCPSRTRNRYTRSSRTVVSHRTNKLIRYGCSVIAEIASCTVTSWHFLTRISTVHSKLTIQRLFRRPWTIMTNRTDTTFQRRYFWSSTSTCNKPFANFACTAIFKLHFHSLN